MDLLVLFVTFYCRLSFSWGFLRSTGPVYHKQQMTTYMALCCSLLLGTKDKPKCIFGFRPHFPGYIHLYSTYEHDKGLREIPFTFLYPPRAQSSHQVSFLFLWDCIQLFNPRHIGDFQSPSFMKHPSFLSMMHRPAAVYMCLLYFSRALKPQLPIAGATQGYSSGFISINQS